MWTYDKKLQYPVKIARPNPSTAKLIISQFGGPDGELGASQRYLSQRYSTPYDEVKATLTDIGTEETAPPSWRSKPQPKGQVNVAAFFLPLVLHSLNSAAKQLIFPFCCEKGRRIGQSKAAERLLQAKTVAVDAL